MTAAGTAVDTTTTKVLVVDDDQFLCEALSMALEAKGFVVRSEADGVAITGALAEFRPDIALVDLNLPNGVNGVDVTRRLRAVTDIPVVFVSGSDRVTDRLAGFEVGADDFVTKPFSISELIARMDAVLRRCQQARPTEVAVGDLVIDESARLVTRSGNVISLRNLEFQLLAMFARHPGQVLSKSQLLDAVWGFVLFDVNLVEVHVSHLRRKLEKHGPRVIHTVRGVGYVLSADRPDC
jgi:two-component system, OmpR family, response regulator